MCAEKYFALSVLFNRFGANLLYLAEYWEDKLNKRGLIGGSAGIIYG